MKLGARRNSPGTFLGAVRHGALALRRAGRRQRGASKFEFALIIALVGCVSLFLAARLKGLEEAGERMEVELTIRNMRVGLQLAIGERIMKGEEAGLQELIGANPVSFLGRTPARYREDDGVAAEPGDWWFDPVSRTLGYRPRQAEAFGSMARLRWQVRARGWLGGRVVGLGLESVSRN